MRTIGVVTVARSDYGIYLPLLRAIQADPELRLHLIVSGAHLSPEFGHSVDHIRADGFEIGDQVEMLLSSDTPQGIAKSIGLGVIGYAQAYSRFRPDMLVVLGDRFEMMASVVAAMPFAIPIAHIHGGEATEGLIDEAIRHSITKMSHLHFVSTHRYKERVIQMGEEPWRVFVSGALSLDNLNNMEFLSKEELEYYLGLSLDIVPLLVTYHPVTLEYEDTSRQIQELLKALDLADMPIVFTYPSADTESRTIIQAIDQFVQTHKRAKAVANLGTQAYFSLMRNCAAMVGNSSSGIIEAASFSLPVVNIGARQRGRIRGSNVIDADYESFSIIEAINKATSPHFREDLKGLINIYGDGNASDRIIDILHTVKLDHTLIEKSFHDIPQQG